VPGISITTPYGGCYTPSEEDFWDEIETELYGADYLLRSVHVETREEAIAGTYRQFAADNKRGGMEVIRRRNVGDSFDQLDHYLELGRTLLPRAWELAAERQLTLEFVRIWMDLQLCHGFLIAHYMDNSDDLTAHRGGLKNRDKLAAQKKWLSHYIAPRLGKRGSIKEALTAALTVIHDRIERPNGPPFGPDWYRAMLNKEGDEFVPSLTTKHLRKSIIIALAREPDDDIPRR
jgi:hypothetical protein